MSTSQNGLLVIPEAEYHAATQMGEYLSSHMLMDFMKCPLTYKQKLDGLIPTERTEAMFLGSAAHKLILEGEDAFSAAYTVSDGPINPKTGETFGKLTKAYKDWLAIQPTPVVSTKDYALFTNMRQMVWKHEDAAILLNEGLAERVVRWEICEGVMAQSRMDWFDPLREVLVDLKTCADLDKFERDAVTMGYITQLAFYTNGLLAAGYQPKGVYIIAVEKQAPYRCGVWQIDEDDLRREEARILNTVIDLTMRMSSDKWETGYEDIRTLSLPAWAKDKQ